MHSLHPELAKLLDGARSKQIASGQIIFYEGDPVDYVSLLVSGVVCMYDIDSEGNRKILHLAGPPSLIPFAFFNNTDTALFWFYEALTDVEMYVLSARALRDAMDNDPALSHSLVGTFALNVHELLVRLSSLNKTHVRDKLLAVLNFLSSHHAVERRGGWFRVNFQINHQLVAEMCGITRESASLGLKELQDDGVIRFPRTGLLEIKKASS